MTSYLHRIGVAVDETLNVIWFNGEADQTISYHSAVANRDGKRWGCVICHILAVIVERDHCQHQLTFPSLPSKPLVVIREAIALIALALPLYGLIKLIEFFVYLV